MIEHRSRDLHAEICNDPPAVHRAQNMWVIYCRYLPSRKRKRMDEGKAPSAVASLLAERVGSGNSYVNEAVQFASAVTADMPSGSGMPRAIRDWASLGGDSQKRSNMERDLHRWLQLEKTLGIRITWVPITVFTKGGLGYEEVLQPVLEPHRLVAAIHASGMRQFGRSLLGDDGDAPQRFWEHCAQERPPWFADHPARKREKEWGHRIPLRMHGDEARFCKQSKLLVLQTASAFVHGCSWDTRLIFTVIASERFSATSDQIRPGGAFFRTASE